MQRSKPHNKTIKYPQILGVFNTYTDYAANSLPIAANLYSVNVPLCKTPKVNLLRRRVLSRASWMWTIWTYNGQTGNQKDSDSLCAQWQSPRGGKDYGNRLIKWQCVNKKQFYKNKCFWWQMCVNQFWKKAKINTKLPEAGSKSPTYKKNKTCYIISTRLYRLWRGSPVSWSSPLHPQSAHHHWSCGPSGRRAWYPAPVCCESAANSSSLFPPAPSLHSTPTMQDPVALQINGGDTHTISGIHCMTKNMQIPKHCNQIWVLKTF